MSKEQEFTPGTEEAIIQAAKDLKGLQDMINALNRSPNLPTILARAILYKAGFRVVHGNLLETTMEFLEELKDNYLPDDDDCDISELASTITKLEELL